MCHRNIYHFSIEVVSLPAATKLGQGNIFTSVCQEFCPQGGRVSASVHAGIHPLGSDPPRTRPPRSRHPPAPWTRSPPGPDQTPQSRHHPWQADSSIWSTSGQYASYWNAFLLLLCISLIQIRAIRCVHNITFNVEDRNHNLKSLITQLKAKYTCTEL